MNRYLCIHGHFYQPPRENPWLEVVERQDSAHPYHDWNARITAECYAPNAVSRILDGRGKIDQIVNNYSRISFNFGPTLLDWLDSEEPDVYKAILEADRESMKHFGGHGSALAQVYNHVIMPLANERDKDTQVRWGVRDFVSRFGRQPEGMWLAETAADVASLEALAAHGIKYTILAPHQAAQIRHKDGGGWHNVEAHTIDTTRAYKAYLPSGRTIDLFFYHGPVSRAVAFERLLTNGERLANRMLDIYGNGHSHPQLAHIATDGETYGHHHAHGDMALAYALEHVQDAGLATLTNYGEFLEKFPPEWEVRIHDNTSWSCAHGVGRWKENCSCNSGGHPGWQQHWRRPLREALNWLRDKGDQVFQEKGKEYLADPWSARNDYVDLILCRNESSTLKFLEQHQSRPLDEDERVMAMQALEMQRHMQLMFTSCAWFFDEVSGIETVQVIKYAARALQLMEVLGGEPLEEQFLTLLEKAPSNIPEHKNARHIYEKWIRPAKVDLSKAAKHYAVICLFEDPPSTRHLPVYSYNSDKLQQWRVGSDRMSVGKIQVRSTITLKTRSFSIAVLFFGKYNIVGAVDEDMDEATTHRMVEDFKEAFLRADITSIYRLLNVYFRQPSFDLSSLFHDQQRIIISQIIAGTMQEVDSLSQQLYHQNDSLIRYLIGLQLDLPQTLKNTVDWVLGSQIQAALDADEFDLKHLQVLLQEAQLLNFDLDHPQIILGLQEGLEGLAEEWRKDALKLEPLQQFQAAVHWVRGLPFHVELYQVQNIFYRQRTKLLPIYKQKKASKAPDDKAWCDTFFTLNEDLRFRSLD